MTFADGTYRSDRTGNMRSTDHSDGPFVAKGAYVAEVLDNDGSPEVQAQAAVPATYNDDAVAYQAEVPYQAATEATPFTPATIPKTVIINCPIGPL